MSDIVSDGGLDPRNSADAHAPVTDNLGEALKLLEEAMRHVPYSSTPGTLLRAAQRRFIRVRNTPTKRPVPPPQCEPSSVIYVEGWNAAVDEFFGGAPAPEPLVVTLNKVIPIPDDVRRYATSMQKDGYRGPLSWARAIIDWVVAQPATNLPTDSTNG